MDHFTMPGVFAKWLYQAHGADRQTWRPMMPKTPAWAVVNGVVRRVEIIALRSATGCGNAADYADCADGRSVSTFYLFPVAKHCKPRLEMLHDEYGHIRQWVAPIKARCLVAR